MTQGRLLITGGFGNVGANAVIRARAQGYDVVVLDVKTPATEKKKAQLEGEVQFETAWGDLTKADTVKQVADLKPDAIVHTAAIIAPVAYVRPKLAEAVNVDGTRHLIEGAESMSKSPKFVMTSSYSVHGPRNPYRDLPPLTGDTPVNPGDNYGKHKIEGEKMLKKSSLDWTIVRLPAVMATDPNFGTTDPSFQKFNFILPLERREHVIDSRDAALALVNAVSASQAKGKMYDVGGPEVDCRSTGAHSMNSLLATRGLPPMPASAFRVPDPQVDEAWYYEDWIDTKPSQDVLKYQEHTFTEYLEFMRKQAGFQRVILSIIAPLIKGQMVKDSPYYGKEQTPAKGTIWEECIRIFNIPPEYQK